MPNTLSRWVALIRPPEPTAKNFDRLVDGKHMHVLLVHGTWAGSVGWAQSESKLWKGLEAGLTQLGYTHTIETYKWSGRNQEAIRQGIAKELQAKVVADRDSRKPGTEYLIVSHSHGGNISTQAVRTILSVDSSFPIRGVVCLNTPFIKNEIRGSVVHLLLWLFLLLAFAVILLTQLGNTLVGVSPNVLETLRLPTVIDRQMLLGTLLAGALVLAIHVLLSLRLRMQIQYEWDDTRPNVLCLSCPDDEPTTGLGLLEGISNLPQLMLHPIVLWPLTLVTLAGLSLKGEQGFCGLSRDCWDGLAGTASLIVLVWIAAALVLGFIGAMLVTFFFGLGWRNVLKTLVSRVLVSYAPLGPARSTFRGISDLPMKVIKPFRLFHSAIYESPETINAICEWLERQIRAAQAGVPFSPTGRPVAQSEPPLVESNSLEVVTSGLTDPT